MASLPSPRLRSLPPFLGRADPSSNRLPTRSLKFSFHDAPAHSLLPQLSRVSSTSRASCDFFFCRCRSSDSGDLSPAEDGPGRRRWDALIQDVVRSAVKRWDDYVTSRRRRSWAQNGPPAEELKKEEVAAAAAEQVVNEGTEKDGGRDWDWERWLRHFAEVEEQENLLSVLKSQLDDAIAREDYEDAAKLKLAITSATENDSVGTAISDLNRAIEEERYCDAAYIRDNSGVALIGWWAGISEDTVDPYGRIIHISAEHGRYLAKSYSPRQLATGRSGLPLFEVYFTVMDGEYKKQAVYLKHNGHSGESPISFSKGPDFSSLNSSDVFGKVEKVLDIEDKESIDSDSDIADGLANIQNLLQDIIPGVRVKVLKVVSPGKVDKDLIAKVVEQIMEEEEGNDEEDSDNVESEDSESVNSTEQREVDVIDTSDHEDMSEVSINVVINNLTPELSAVAEPKSLIRTPARLEIKCHSSFSLLLNKDVKALVIDAKSRALRKKAAAQRNADLLISDIAKAIKSKEKVHMKVLKDIGELIGFAVNHKQDYHVLTGATRFSRIEIPSSSDPLSGLYVGTHGMYSSNILHLKRKFGQWQQEHATQKPANLEFYEYVEAIKLTGDPSVPAGEVAFRAKVGKRYQLPHKGIIPEEFGVVARYRGQGRLADPGYQNPRWVDGELVILDGKYIRAGPVIGFLYWAPESHFLLFFNRLKLPE